MIGLMTYPQMSDLPLSIIFRIGLNLWFLMITINAYTFFFSSISREAGKVTQRATGLTLFFYFLSYTVKLWDKASFLKPVTIFTYYQSQALTLNQNLWLKNIVVLASVIIIFMVIAFRRITRRDIPGLRNIKKVVTDGKTKNKPINIQINYKNINPGPPMIAVSYRKRFSDGISPIDIRIVPIINKIIDKMIFNFFALS